MGDDLLEIVFSQGRNLLSLSIAEERTIYHGRKK